MKRTPSSPHAIEYTGLVHELRVVTVMNYNKFTQLQLNVREIGAEKSDNALLHIPGDALRTLTGLH